VGGIGGDTFIRGINRGAGTPRGSYISPGNQFNVNIEYIWVVAVAIHLIEALRLQYTKSFWSAMLYSLKT